MNGAAGPAHDPRPQPPEKPLPMDCCESGCPVCVHDAYASELERYRAALADWQARHPEARDQPLDPG